MRVIAYINENPFWLDVLESLHASGHEIAYVFGSPPNYGNFRAEVGRRFPAAKYHDHYAAIRCEFDEPIWDRPLTFDPAARYVWEGKGHLILDVMSRLDSDNSFSYRERRKAFYSYLKFADYLDNVLHIDGIVASVVPHDPFLSVVSSLFRARGKPVASFSPSNHDGYLLPFEEMGSNPSYAIRRVYDQLLAEGREARLPENIVHDFERIRGRGAKASAIDSQYISKWLTKTFGSRSLMQQIKGFGHLLLKDGIDAIRGKTPEVPALPTRFEKEPGRSLEDSFKGLMPRLRDELWNRANRRRVRALAHQYRKYVDPSPLPENFIFVPLHYQPELTSNPLGDAFVFQILLLETLSAALPAGWKVVAKEHPSQHNPWLGYACQGREARDYQMMSSIPGVQLVSTDVDQFDLMDRCKAVATITGTAGWESLLRGKPVLAFGNAWWRQCNGVFQIGCVADAADALQRIRDGYIPERREAELFAEAVEKCGAAPYVGKDGDFKPWALNGYTEERRQDAVERHADLLRMVLAEPTQTAR